MNLRFRGEFFNIFNHPNFDPPDNNITDALFGYSTATLASSLGSGGPDGGLNPLCHRWPTLDPIGVEARVLISVTHSLVRRAAFYNAAPRKTQAEAWQCIQLLNQPPIMLVFEIRGGFVRQVNTAVAGAHDDRICLSDQR
jgi:hypothetical protein